MKAINHFLPFLLLLVPLAWGLYGYYKTRTVNSTGNSKPTQPAWPLIINSAVLYTLAFNLIFFIQELFLALGKRWLGLKAYLYHNNHHWEGTHPMEGLAQGYGAAAIFITGLVCLLLLKTSRNSTHWSQLLLLWLAFQGLAQSIPQFITASIAPGTDMGQAFTYLGFGKLTGLIISIAGVIAMLVTGAAFSGYLLRLAPATASINTPPGRFQYLMRIAVLAALLGILLIIPFRIMPWSRAVAPVEVTLLSIPMVFANGWKVSLENTINSSVNYKLYWLPVALLGLLLIFFQLVLAKGVEL